MGLVLSKQNWGATALCLKKLKSFCLGVSGEKKKYTHTLMRNVLNGILEIGLHRFGRQMCMCALGVGLLKICCANVSKSYKARSELTS